MLEHVEVIDECDTLGQKLDVGNAIHKVRRAVASETSILSPSEILNLST